MTHDFSPLKDAQWPQEIADLKDGFAGRLNVYRTMAHHPALLRGWAPLREHVVRKTTLGAERSEVVILRTGLRLGAEYEIAHHIARATAIGMERPRIDTILGPLDGMAENDATLARAVDELCESAALTPATRRALETLTGPQGVLDLMATVGFYTTLAFLVKSFDVPIDDDLTLPPAR
ncbi:carboxymuconolactone decarboxylase family protein [Roseovarius aestuariivivens]|uniref:carboxymuconolactone decarboxylase family protein n=1 Tax=Roseovarius aestuariivivens TaxID=1888910 RepID=UPI0010822EF5|nr:carboxymuconolactone decarboxylase family protein [Roseovarius aestuariivivens]